MQNIFLESIKKYSSLLLTEKKGCFVFFFPAIFRNTEPSKFHFPLATEVSEDLSSYHSTSHGWRTISQ